MINSFIMAVSHSSILDTTAPRSTTAFIIMDSIMDAYLASRTTSAAVLVPKKGKNLANVKTKKTNH